MKVKEFSALARKLLPVMPGYSVNGALIIAQPIGHVLRGICFDGSDFSRTNFVPFVFFMPLAVPASHIVLSNGFRLTNARGLDSWSADDPQIIENLSQAIVEKALSFLDQVSSLSNVARTLESRALVNAHALEAIACCRALNGESEAAVAALDQIEQTLDLRYAWRVELRDRAATLARLLRTDPAAARQKLLENEAQTLRNIGLGEMLESNLKSRQVCPQATGGLTPREQVAQSEIISEIQQYAERAGNGVREVTTGWTKVNKVISMKRPLHDTVRRKFKNDPRIRFSLTDYDGHYGDHSWREGFLDEQARIIIDFPRTGNPIISRRAARDILKLFLSGHLRQAFRALRLMLEAAKRWRASESFNRDE